MRSNRDTIIGMQRHLRYAGLTPAEQEAAVVQLVRANSELMNILATLHGLQLPDLWIASGAIYQNIWNALTERPAWTGVKDIDVIYFDAQDLRYDAEDEIIREVDRLIPQPPVPIEVRNQARVHLWFGAKFGFEVPPLVSSLESLQRYASKSHAVAVQLDADGDLNVAAPFGLDDIFSFRVRPNPVYDNRTAHTEKGRRARLFWPEVSVIPWPQA